jgi:hypothetical protein
MNNSIPPHNSKEVHMKRLLSVIFIGIFVAACAAPAVGQSKGKGHRDHVKYEKRHRDPVLQSMEHEADSLKAVSDSITAVI